MADPILDVDPLAFEQGDSAARRATIDGVMASLATGFVYCDRSSRRSRSPVGRWLPLTGFPGVAGG